MKGLDGRSKWQVDAKLITYLIVIIIVTFATIMYTIPKLRSSSKVECADLKRVNIPEGDKDYYPSLDGDHDKIACDK